MVFYFNTQLMQAYWTAHPPASGLLGVVDLESSGDPYSSLKSDFKLAKDLVAADAIAQGATDAGFTAVTEAYHATLVAPFCLAAAKSFFGNF